MYTKRERSIFGPYDNGSGQGVVFGDPMKIWRTLQFHTGGELDKIVEQHKARIPDPQKDQKDWLPDEQTAFEPTNRLLHAAIVAFGLVPFDPVSKQGLLEREIIELVDLFFGWLKKKETQDAPTQTQPPSMDLASLARKGLRMESFSPSGSTSPASSLSSPGSPSVARTMPVVPSLTATPQTGSPLCPSCQTSSPIVSTEVVPFQRP